MPFTCSFFLNGFPYLFVLYSLVTPCLLVAVQPCLGWMPIWIFCVKDRSLNMFLTYFGSKNFSLSRIWILFGEPDDIEIRITNDEYYMCAPVENKITTLKNLIEMREITLNDPKFGINKSLDTFLHDWLNS